MALMLAAPLLAQPAKASGSEIEPYEGTPLFLVAILDSNKSVSGVMNAFLVHDPETGGTFLLGSSKIYDLVQEDYTICILGDDEYFNAAIPLAKENGVSYLYTLGLENAPYLVLSEGSGKKAATMHREVDSDGITDPIQNNYNLSSGWTEDSNGLLTYSGHQIDNSFLIGAPMVSAEDSSVLGCITVNSDLEMTLAPLKRGKLSTAYCLETLYGGSPSGSSSGSGNSGSSSSGSGSSSSGTSGSGSSGTGNSENGTSGLVWIAVIAVVGVLGYLIYRANTKKKNAGPKEGTVPLDLSDSAPLPGEPTDEPAAVQEAYGSMIPNQGSTIPVSRWQLRCVSGTLNDRTFPLGSTLRIGRSPQCDISFPENTPGVSGSHCEVSPEGDHVVVRDLNSTYGTYLGANNRLEAYRSYELHTGDIFTLAPNGQAFCLEKMGVSTEESGPAVRDLTGRTYRADAGGRLSFGRSSGNQVRISADEQSVSGSHCVLYREAGKLYLMDLGSTNGTFFSDQQRLKSNIPYRIRRGMAFFLSNPRNTFVVTEE